MTEYTPSSPPRLRARWVLGLWAAYILTNALSVAIGLSAVHIVEVSTRG